MVTVHFVILFVALSVIFHENTFQAHIGPLKLQLVNTHLESTRDHASERVKQLKDCFKTAQEFPEQYTVVLAGDLNLRDKEVNYCFINTRK